MCSYNKVDGTFACENKEVLIDLLKEEVSRVSCPSRFSVLTLGLVSLPSLALS